MVLQIVDLRGCKLSAIFCNRRARSQAPQLGLQKPGRDFGVAIKVAKAKHNQKALCEVEPNLLHLIRIGSMRPNAPFSEGPDLHPLSKPAHERQTAPIVGLYRPGIAPRNRVDG